MGEVYKARDPRLDRTVAVKISREQFSERFEREAHAVAALSHPHICTLYDVGPNYLVMEYLEGETLAARLAKGPLPVREALKYAVQIASALDAAHRLKITHRDLKPQNIILTRSGAKLLDFGLAKIKPAPADDRTLTQALTGAGTIVGTFQYMAPETLAGAEADDRSDIFAFGAVLYEMLTGRRAFDGKSQATIIGAILHTEPRPLRAEQPLVPAALEHLIGKCLAKDPEERWQNAHDLAGELQWIGDAGSQVGVPAVPLEHRITRKRLSRILSAVLAVALIGTTSIAVRHWREQPPASHPIRFRIEPPPGQGGIGTFVLSPDGDKMAFSFGSAGRSRVYLRSFNSLTAQPLAGAEDGFPLAFSPDGRSIALVAGNHLRRIDPSSGAEQTICDLGNLRPFTASWSKDDVLLFGTSGGPLMQVPASGGVPQPASIMDRSREEGFQVVGSFLPDGRHFLFFTTSVSYGRRTVLVGRLGDLQWRKIILEGTGPARYAAPGKVMYTRENSLVARAFDVGKLEFAGEPIPIANGLAGIQQAPNMSPFFRCVRR
jgi:serine/threonine protein kinase